MQASRVWRTCRFFSEPGMTAPLSFPFGRTFLRTAMTWKNDNCSAEIVDVTAIG
jgi:hypothetical protein